jgi:hypothetical protein
MTLYFMTLYFGRYVAGPLGSWWLLWQTWRNLLLGCHRLGTRSIRRRSFDDGSHNAERRFGYGRQIKWAKDKEK